MATPKRPAPAGKASASPRGEALSPTVTRDPQPIPQLDSTVDRVEYIASRMRSFDWVRGKSWKEISAAWGIGKDRCEVLAAEASRKVKSEILDPDDVGATVGLALRQALTGALNEGDWKAIGGLARVLADVAGAGSPQRHAVETKQPGWWEAAPADPAAKSETEGDSEGKPQH